jgi:hypothetical protein
MINDRFRLEYLKCSCGYSKKDYKMVDWTDPKSMVSKYFSVHEALYLPTWARLATEDDGLTDEIKANLIILCQKMDIARDYFGRSINVHVTFRPLRYNKLIGGAPNSAHAVGKACDFDISGLTCDEARAKIMADDKLDEWNMRMEKRDGSDWIHLDCYPVLHSRYFLP